MSQISVEETLTSKLPKRTLNAGRVRTARMRRGLSQAEFARLLNVSDRTVRAYEKSGAPTDLAEVLCRTLDFPAEYFTLDAAPEIEYNTVTFRAGRSSTKRARDMAIASGQTAIEVHQWISTRFTLPPVKVPDLEAEDPQMAARLIRSAWGLGSKPLPNLVQLCESRGIRVGGIVPVASTVDAYSCWNDSIPSIFIALHKTPERARFNLAHELGHLILHQHLTGKPTAEDEHEANAFASEFLLPRESIAEYTQHNPTIDEILQVKQAFQVSAFALA